MTTAPYIRPRYLTVAETAKLIRAALKKEFPGVKFSVRSDSYAGGASINVSWTDGPISSKVDAVVDPFKGATFDGMIDLKSYVTGLLDGEVVHFGADFVFTNRQFTPELLAKHLDMVYDAVFRIDPTPSDLKYYDGVCVDGYERVLSGDIHSMARRLAEAGL